MTWPSNVASGSWDAGSVSQTVVTLGAVTNAGDTLFVGAREGGSGGTCTLEVSYDNGTTWSSLTGVTSNGQAVTNSGQAWAFYQLSMTATTNSGSSVCKLRSTFGAAQTNRGCWATYSGTSVFDVAGFVNNGSSVFGTTSTGSISPSGSRLMIAFGIDGRNSSGQEFPLTPGTSNGLTWTDRVESDSGFGCSCYILDSNGAFTGNGSATNGVASFAGSNADNSGGWTLAFSQSGGGGSNALVATLAGVGHLSSALSLTKNLSSTIAGVGHLTPGLSVAKHLSCTLAGVGHLTAPLSVTKNLGCSIAGHGTLASSLSLTKNLSTTLAGHGALIAALTGSSGSNALAAVLAGRSTFTSNLTTHLSCSIAGHSTTTAVLSLSKNLSTTISGVGHMTAPLSVTKLLSCTIAGHGSQTAALSLVKNLSAALSGRGSLVGAISLAKLLSTTLSGTAAVISTLQGGSISLMAALNGHAAMSAQWSIVPTSTCIDLFALKRITVAMSGETTTAIPVSGISLISVKMTGKVC